MKVQYVSKTVKNELKNQIKLLSVQNGQNYETDCSTSDKGVYLAEGFEKWKHSFSVGSCKNIFE